MTSTVEDRTKDVLSAVFGISVDQIGNDSSSQTIESWDSLRHMSLVMALEEEFGLKIEDDELLQMQDFESILSVLRKSLG
tara:strand:- start:269 stop:508 length:240 start_codon:yes stop_codon:yes gene_type:complete